MPHAGEMIFAKSREVLIIGEKYRILWPQWDSNETQDIVVDHF